VGAALTAAAVDCRRAGLTRPVARQLLEQLYPLYLDGPISHRLTPALIEQGLAWAAVEVHATSALLTPHDGGHVAFDYLPDRLQTDPAAAAVPGRVWTGLLPHLPLEDAASFGIAAYSAGQPQVAEQAFRRAADAGDHSAEFNLGVLLQQLGRVEEAERWYRRAADADHHGAEFDLGVLLKELGRVEEAERWYHRAADADHHGATQVLERLAASRAEPAADA